jgi:hypothetical protein
VKKPSAASSEAEQEGGHGAVLLGHARHEDLEHHDDPAGVRDGLAEHAPLAVRAGLREEVGDPDAEHPAQVVVEGHGVDVLVDVERADVEEHPERQPEEHAEEDQEGGELQVGQDDRDLAELGGERLAVEGALGLLVEEAG